MSQTTADLCAKQLSGIEARLHPLMAEAVVVVDRKDMAQKAQCV